MPALPAATRRTQVEDPDSLKKELEVAELMLRGIKDGLIFLDPEGRIGRINPAMEGILGVKYEHARGRPLREVVKEGEVCLMITGSTGGGKVFAVKGREYEVASTEMRDTEGRPLGVMSVFRDVTERRRLEQEKADFLSMVTHDLKSPLVTIRGFLGYLREDVASGDLIRIDKDLVRIVNATETMQNLLNDLLELSRIGRIVNPLENIEFGKIVKETLNLILNPSMTEKIKIEIQEDLPVVHCDHIRITEVIQNLVTNAMKFMGDQPEPLIQIGMAGRDHETNYPILFIKDNGIGIEPQHHERVFGLFNRLNPDNEGTGIGLAIVKRVIEVHGGRIWVESEGRNKGSTFYFTLPFAEL